MMVVVHVHDDEHQWRSAPALELFPRTSPVQGDALLALLGDFFDWLETSWKLPLSSADTKRVPLPVPFALAEGLYTAADLSRLYGYHPETIAKMLKRSGIFPSQCGKGGQCALYKRQDLAPQIAWWERQRLLQVVDQWWLRFFPPACGACSRCRENDLQPGARQIHCCANVSLKLLRSVFTAFWEEACHVGSVGAWWNEHHADTWKRGERPAWGIVLIYVLDRQLLHLSHTELLQLSPVCDKGTQNLTRLWRNRRPEEYEQFLQAMKAANYRGERLQEQVLMMVSLLILLKYGLPGITELGRILSSGEMQQMCSERRFVTAHLGCGIFLPFPLTADLCVGHVILDDIRFCLWHYAAEHRRSEARRPWQIGPRHWKPLAVKLIEQALAAPVYEGKRAILSRRPETERTLSNPWRLVQEGTRADSSYALLSESVQKHIMAYLTYCYQELHMELTTLCGRAESLMRFFTWVRKQETCTEHPSWTKETAQIIFRRYASIGCSELKANTRQQHLQKLAHFFATLADLEYPVPAGYRLLYTLEKNEGQEQRFVPSEEVLDRVFRDGVCRLDYDPFARLALTIQYYCGTRVTETCDLHLFCVLEDRNGHVYLLIPKGKTKEERPFPIVELGMGLLLEYMDEIVRRRLAPDGTSRTLGKTNVHYLDDDPERANDWQYLFDRVPDDVVKQRGRLSASRVQQALAEALIFAAQVNPNALFQEAAYDSVCQRRKRRGQYCAYFAAREGITTCPCCGSPLSGKRGMYCYHVLEEDLVCNGRSQNGEAFCPKCDQPLAAFLPITTHIFRHNSVSRAHRAGVSLAQNMRLHGHKTVPMHLRYLHLLLEDTTNEVRQIFTEKRLRDVRQILGSAAGKIVEGGIAYTVSLEHYLGITLQRALKRRTYGIWGGFWAGTLAQRGIASPLSIEDEIVIPEDTYEHTVAQYWYEALGLAVSEIAFEQITKGKWRAEVPPFLDRHKIEDLVQFHLHHVADSLTSALGQRLMETDILEQRRFLDDLAEKLRPWWEHLGTVDQLVEMFAPGGGHAFQKQLPPTEPTS